MKTENELIEDFWISQGGKPHWKPDLSFYESSWDMLMPVVTLLLNKLRFTNWKTRDQHEWAEVHRTHLERRLLDYIYDDNTYQSDFVQEIIEGIKWYNSQNS